MRTRQLLVSILVLRQAQAQVHDHFLSSKRLDNGRYDNGRPETVLVHYMGDNLKTLNRTGNSTGISSSRRRVRPRIGPSILDPSIWDNPISEDLELSGWDSFWGKFELARVVWENGMTFTDWFDVDELASDAEVEVGTAPEAVVSQAGMEVAGEAGMEVAVDVVADGAVGGLICPPCFAVAAVVALLAAVVATPFIISAKWDRKREQFTKETTSLMMWIVDNDKHAHRYIAASVCYNKGYDVSDLKHAYGRSSRKLKWGLLHTDYDCMYLRPPVAFWTRDDGGYQNLAYSYHPDKCWFDDSTGDLTCP